MSRDRLNQRPRYQRLLRMGRRARGTDGLEPDREEQSRWRKLIGADRLEGRTRRTAKIERAGRMVLHPLTEIGVRVFVAVRIGRGQLMMDVLRDGERG